MLRQSAALILLAIVLAAGCGGSTQDRSDGNNQPRESMTEQVSPKFMHASGCTPKTTEADLGPLNSRAVYIVFDDLERTTAAHMLEDQKWRSMLASGGNLPSPDQLRKDLTIGGSGIRFGCHRGRMYVQEQSIDTTDEICPVDLQGVYSSTRPDTGAWRVEGLACAGDIGPICSDTPKPMRAAWYGSDKAMADTCRWR